MEPLLQPIRRHYRAVLLCTVIVIVSLYVFLATGATKKFRGQYSLAVYMEGPFYGTTAIREISSDKSLSTSFGTYPIGKIIQYSDVKLTHSYKGYISIKSWRAWVDEEGNLIKSESTWTINITRYERVTIRMTYEFGDYQVLQNTENTYEETYMQKYYEDGDLEESIECRDLMQVEAEENKTTEAGTYECIRIRMTYFENAIYEGYSLSWITKEGTLIQNQEYDNNDMISMEMSLISESEPFHLPLELFLVILVIGGVIIGFCIIRRRKTPSLKNNYLKMCPRCTNPIAPLAKFCGYCGANLEEPPRKEGFNQREKNDNSRT